MWSSVFIYVDVIEPIFNVVGVLYLNPAPSITTITACAPRLSTESTHFTYSLTSRTERRKTRVLPFKNALKSE